MDLPSGKFLGRFLFHEQRFFTNRGKQYGFILPISVYCRTIEPFARKGHVQTQSKASLIVDELSAEEIKEFGESLESDNLSDVGEVSSSSGLSIVEDQDDVQIVLDWKGEPMKINPNDKLPFRFD